MYPGMRIRRISMGVGRGSEDSGRRLKKVKKLMVKKWGRGAAY
jgi:hypothetical protein